MESITIMVPLPSPLLTPNLRLHWAQVRRASREQREAAMLATYAALASLPGTLTRPLFPSGRVRLDVTVSPRPRMRQHDDDNFWAGLKATRDGLADAGLVANDRQIVSGRLDWQATRNGTLTLTLTAEEG